MQYLDRAKGAHMSGKTYTISVIHANFGAGGAWAALHGRYAQLWMARRGDVGALAGKGTLKRGRHRRSSAAQRNHGSYRSARHGAGNGRPPGGASHRLPVPSARKRICRAVPIWSFRDTDLRFSFMAASGTGTPVARTARHRRPGRNSGKKFRGNVERDRRVCEQLERLHWRTLIVWECEAEDPARPNSIFCAA